MPNPNSALVVSVGVDGISAAQAQITQFGNQINQSFARVGASAASVNALSSSTRQLSSDAAKAGEHISGLSYYFRSGIDSIRFAAAGGGARAGFYAIDEGVRALLASGMKLSNLVPVLGVLGAAVGAGVIVWHEWNYAQEQAIKNAKDLADAWKALPGLVKEVNDMTQTGLLGPSASNEYIQYLTGKKKLYVNSEGQTTPQATEEVAGTSLITVGGTTVAAPSDQKVMQPNRPATEAEIQQWVQDQITADGQVTKEHLDALNNIREETQQINAEALTGIEKQKAEIRDRYQREREELETNIEIAKASLDNASPLSLSERLRRVVDPNDPYNRRIAGINFDNNPVIQSGEKALAESKKREAAELAAVQAKSDEQRLASLNKLYNAYQTLFREVNKDISEASAGQARLDKKQLDALKQQSELRQEIARGQIEAQLKGISDNPFLTTQQKTDQSIPLYQQQLGLNAGRMADLSHTAATSSDASAQLEAQKQIVELQQQQVMLQQKLSAAQGASSWTYQLQAAVTHFENINTLAQQTTQIFSGALTAGIDSVASNMTRVIEGTESWHKALLNVGETVLTTLIEGIIKMGEEWVIQEMLKLAVSETVNTTAAATSTATAALLAKVWEPAAIYSAIATDGVSLAAGVSAAALGAFASGGFTGNGGQHEVAGVVHRGEYVFSAPAVDRIGVPALEALHNGGSAATPQAGGPPQNTTHKVVVVMDRQGLLNEYKKLDFAQITVAHVFNNRRKAGIQT